MIASAQETNETKNSVAYKALIMIIMNSKIFVVSYALIAGLVGKAIFFAWFDGKHMKKSKLHFTFLDLKE